MFPRSPAAGPVMDDAPPAPRASMGGAGANASTWAGVYVLASVGVLWAIRRSFRKYQ
jgi:hypothetical protein